MSARLAAGVEVSALIRRAQMDGGNAAVLAKGDPQAGAILLWLAEKGRLRRLYARRLTIDGHYGWESTGPENIDDIQSVNDYIDRRRGNDTDLWVIELDVADAERFAAELAATG